MISSLFLAFVILSVILEKCSGHSAKEWKDRTIYQILTDRFAVDDSDDHAACSNLSKYCGGTYKGLEMHLDYITGMGFDAIWISPMLLNLGDDYHGYAFLDLYELNDHFGSESDLKSFIQAAHERDVWVMLDVVANHVAPVDMSFEMINPFNESVYYHSKCAIEDWSNQEQVENCRLANLPDLDQSNAYVRSTLIDWVSELKSKYDFDGLRIDTVPEVSPDFWAEYSEASGLYCVGEVLNGDVTYVSNYQNYMDGVLSYPLYYTMKDVFMYQQSMFKLQDMIGPDGAYLQEFKDISLLGTFVDNHDNPRFLSGQSDWNLYKNAITLTLFNSGIPIIYYGTEQGYFGGNDPANRESLWPNYDTSSELYKFVQTVVGVRKLQKVALETQVQRYAADDFYAFTRGDVLVCLTNVGSSGADVVVDLTYIPYEDGDQLCNLLESAGSDCVEVQDGTLSVTLTGGLPKIYVLNQ